MSIQIGAPIALQNSRGFVYAVNATESGRQFVIGATMRPITANLKIVWDDGRISEVPDAIAADGIEAAQAMGMPHIADVETPYLAARAKENARDTQNKLDFAASNARRAAWDIEAAGRTPANAKAVIIAELIEDKSDSQSDYFGSRAVRTVILGFSTHTRDLFSEMRKAALNFPETAFLATAPDSAEHRQKYSMGGGYYLKSNYRHSDGWKVSKQKFYGDSRTVPMGEWALDAPALEAAPASSTPALEAAPMAAGFKIEKHTHTKKGFDMFIVIMPDRVERAEFDRLRDMAQGAGGWYSRPWAGTPGGFAFKLESAAAAFAGQGAPVDATPDQAPGIAAPVKAPLQPPAVRAGMGDKLRGLAAKLQSDIDNKLGNRLTNTPKRQREAASARQEGRRLERTQQALTALAGLHDAGAVPAALAKVTTKAAAYNLMRSEIDRQNAGYYDAGVDTGKPALSTPEALALWALINGPTDDEKAAESLRVKVQALQFANIDGYFPTPADIIANMIEAAGIPENAPVSILEPSAGSGAILEALKARFPAAKLSAYERHASLCDVLRLKGFELTGSDFTEAPRLAEFDFVLMNPPFEKGQDMAHVQHAFAMLKPGGRLVAIMSPGPFFRQDSKAREFRAWFDDLAGERTEIEAGAFKESGTGVATVMVELHA